MRPPVFAGPMLRQRRSCSSAGSRARAASLTAPATRIVPERITKRSRIGAVYVGFYHLVGCRRAPRARARTASLRAPQRDASPGGPREQVNMTFRLAVALVFTAATLGSPHLGEGFAARAARTLDIYF